MLTCKPVQNIIYHYLTGRIYRAKTVQSKTLVNLQLDYKIRQLPTNLAIYMSSQVTESRSMWREKTHNLREGDDGVSQESSISKSNFLHIYSKEKQSCQHPNFDSSQLMELDGFIKT